MTTVLAMPQQHLPKSATPTVAEDVAEIFLMSVLKSFPKLFKRFPRVLGKSFKSDFGCDLRVVQAKGYYELQGTAK